MKKLIILFCFVVLTTPKVNSQIFIENFIYDAIPPTILSTTPTWDIASAGINPILVDFPGGLIFPTYAGSGIGNAPTLATTGEDDSASLSSVQTTGSIYSSFMIRVASAQTTGDYFFALATTGNAFASRVYIRPDAVLGYNIGISKSASASIDYTTTSYSFLTTYLVIAKYTFVAGAGNDQVSLFVFDSASPPPVTEPTPTVGPITSGTGTDAINLSRVILRQGGSSIAANLIIDGIYVSTSYDNTVLPVELAAFTSTIINRNVTLNWTTVSELNNAGFEIERSSVNSSWTRVGNIAGNGTTVSNNNYSFTDRGLATGSYNYRLKQIDLNGNYEYFNLSNEVNIGVPTKFDLSQNYPNPFNPSTKINYDLPFDGKVSIKIFDMAGKEVETLLNEVKAAGYYTLDFNASSLSSGIYFYTLSAEANGQNFVSTKKMMLIK
ncbi:MAG: T9SS type A sorting domain-containing protein [Bacteroidota bacterium]|nr:T9SS type A sorting domain-containing protein [Bacteroidota bacterium]